MKNKVLNLCIVLFIFISFRINGHTWTIKDAIDFKFANNFLIIITESGDEMYLKSEIIERLIIKR